MGVRSAAVFASKRFSVHQDRVGMKVGIDGIVLAAAAARATLHASSCAGRGDQVVRLLDVGCGCGIIALLLRQAASFAGQRVHVTALDIDAPAAEQARENVARSPWPADIDVQHSSLQDFVTISDGTARSFDLVVSNPPYFPRPPRHVELHSVANRATQLKCHDGSSTCSYVRNMNATNGSLWPQSRAHARFREYLPPHDLLRDTAALLAPHGQFWCVYPASEEVILLQAAQAAGLQQRNRLGLKFKADLPVARVVLSFGLSSQCATKGMATSISAASTAPLVDEELAVRHDDKTYTEEFVALTQMCYGKVLPTAAQ